ncbi:MAG TPA: glycosyltransferase family 4 protein [Terriglobales bacterium]|nr:glycosyltransferase family 4 protein [Terriglobales bacterium]
MPRSPSDIVVLITGAFHAFGGIETFNRCLIRALDQVAARNDRDVRIFSLLDNSEQFSPMSLGSRLEIQCFSGNRIRFLFAALAAARRAGLVLFGHVNFSPLAPLTGSPAKSLFVYGVDVWRKLPMFQKFGVSRMQRILSISSFTAESMGSLNRIEQDRFTILPLTLDPAYIDNGSRQTCGRDELGLPSGPMLLTVSRLSTSDTYKNIDCLIQALPPIFERFPDAFSVIIGDGDDRARLQRLSHDLGIAAKVLFSGRVSDRLLPAYHKNCDIFVLPSTKEGFGIVFLEAMYYGKPCIGANWGGVPEVVANNRTGILVDSPSPANIQNALLRLLDDASLRRTLGERGKARFEQEFAFPRFCERVERIVCPKTAADVPQAVCAASKLA